tara:strand:+ start:188 stop:457 length:270 start_codon:yes stop_codon:yes gene_type:complete
MKKEIILEKSADAVALNDLPKATDYKRFQLQMLRSGRVSVWKGTDYVDNKSTVTIECDSAGTYDEIVAFSKSLGDWRPGYTVISEKTID